MRTVLSSLVLIPPLFIQPAAAQDAAAGETWDEATFAEYIKNPKARIPGTKTIFAGIKSEKEIKGLTAFLKQLDKDGRKL